MLLPEGAWFSRLSPEAVGFSVCMCMCVRACVYYWSKTESLLSNGGICISHSTTFLVVRSECQLNLLEWKQYVNWYMPAALSGFWWVCAWMFVCIIVCLFVCVCVCFCVSNHWGTSCWKMRCVCVCTLCELLNPQLQCPGWCHLVFVCAQQITYPLHPTTP